MSHDEGAGAQSPDTTKATTVAVLMTVFNRVEQTRACLYSLSEALPDTDANLRVFVTDDGSTDGSAQRIRAEFVGAQVIDGSGCLYWSAGMEAAQRVAQVEEPDYLLWLNNDVILEPLAISRLLALSEGRRLVVGALHDKDGRTSYSGFKRSSPRPGDYIRVDPTSDAQAVDTINGNVVLVPRNVYSKLGTVDGSFDHAYGDWDYGLRARRAGFEVLLAPGYVGLCDRNSPEGSWRDRRMGRGARFRELFGRKGYPIVSHFRFVRRHGGRLWPTYVFATYSKAILMILIGR